MILELIKKSKISIEFINYCLIGLLGVTIDFFIFWVLYRKFNIYYQFANIISVSCGLTNNYFLNAFLNFKVTEKLLVRYFKFFSIGLIGLSIGSFFLYLATFFHFPILWAKGFIIVFLALLQFSLNKLITFRVVDTKNSLDVK